MRLTGEKLRLSSNGGGRNPWRILVLVVLITAGVFTLWMRDRGRVQPLFLPTPTPTRSAATYIQEAEAHFSAGDLDRAIEAYRNAVLVDPSDPELWANLARVQTYSSDLLTTLEERRARLQEAREAIDEAVTVNPDSALAYAIRALVYDWSAAAEVREAIGIGDEVRVVAELGEGGILTASLIEAIVAPEMVLEEIPVDEDRGVTFTGAVETISDEIWVVGGRPLQITPFTDIQEGNRRETFLTEAQISATKARQLDQTSSLAIAFLAEVLVDQGNVAQAADLAQRAAQQIDQSEQSSPYDMDVYRVHATVLEHQAQYLRAIEEYNKAVRLNPNLTFLYLKIGANYRRLRDIETALDYFARAAKINEQLGIEDPNPYLAIGRTYMQDGEFFISALNMERALAIDPSNPEIFARLASTYFQARNYESAIPVFKCALDGCGALESGDLLCELEVFVCEPGSDLAAQIGRDVPGMPLNDRTLEYYYTYGSALTFYAGDEEHPTACDDAERVFSQLMAKYGTDPLVRAIVEEGRAICANPGAPALPPAAATATPAG
jgi:tetratricopeptide (TPR) repeat protein